MLMCIQAEMKHKSQPRHRRHRAEQSHATVKKRVAFFLILSRDSWVGQMQIPALPSSAAPIVPCHSSCAQH